MELGGAWEGSSGYENIDQLPSGEGNLLQIKQEGGPRQRTKGLQRPGARGKRHIRKLLDKGFPSSLSKDVV